MAGIPPHLEQAWQQLRAIADLQGDAFWSAYADIEQRALDSSGHAPETHEALDAYLRRLGRVDAHDGFV